LTLAYFTCYIEANINRTFQLKKLPLKGGIEMEKFKRISWIATEVFIYLSIGTALIYFPMILSRKFAVYGDASEWIKIAGFLMIIIVMEIIYDHCAGSDFWLTLGAFIFSPWIELLTAYCVGFGNKEDAIKLIFASLICFPIIALTVAAFARDREYRGNLWKCPSSFKKQSWQR